MTATKKAWLHPKDSKIRIQRFLNRTKRNGQREMFGESFRVTVPRELTGRGRERRQFKTRADAESWAEEQYRGTKVLGEQFFDLDKLELREAVAAFDLLRPRSLSLRQFVADALAAVDALPKGVSLIQAAQYAAPRMKPAGGDKTVDEIVEEIIASKEVRHRNGQLRDRSLRDFRSRARIFSARFGAHLIASVTAADIKAWIIEQDLSTRSNLNNLNAATEILRYALQRRYLGIDPLTDLTDADRKELCGHVDDSREPHILTIDQARTMLETALENPRLDLLAYTTLALFCGVRSAELLKLRWDHVTDDYVIVPPGVAKKRRVRHVDLPECAKAWLALCPRKTGQIVDASYAAFGRRFFELRTRAGFELWHENSMRHSYGSYHFAKFGNALETARQMGHSQGDDTLFAYYRHLTTKADGEAFFSILPPRTDAKILPLPQIAK